MFCICLPEIRFEGGVRAGDGGAAGGDAAHPVAQVLNHEVEIHGVVDVLIRRLQC